MPGTTWWGRAWVRGIAGAVVLTVAQAAGAAAQERPSPVLDLSAG